MFESNDAMCRRVKSQFRGLDNGLGVVCKGKLSKLLKSVEDPLICVDALVAELDLDSNGVLDFNEFMEWAFDGGDGEKALRKAWDISGHGRVQRLFDKLDRDGDDFLSYEDFSEMLIKLDPHAWTEERINILFSYVDKDHNGSICFHEFLDWAFAGNDEAEVVQLVMDPKEAARRRKIVEVSPVVAEPESGEHTGIVLVELYSATPGIVIHYTIDGSEPTEESPVYKGAIALDWTLGDVAFVKAFAVVAHDRAVDPTPVVTRFYRIAPPPVRFELDGDALSLSAEIGVEAVHYTLDGTEPTPESDMYKSPIPVTADVASVKAIAVCGKRQSREAAWRPGDA